MSTLAKLWSDAGFVASIQGGAKSPAKPVPTTRADGEVNDGLEPPVNPEVPVILEKILIEPADSSMDAGEQKQYTATGVYAGGATRDLTKEVKWSSLPTDIVTIDENGIVTAGETSGTAKITAMDPATLVRGETDVSVVGQEEPLPPDQPETPEEPPTEERLPDEAPPEEAPPDEAPSLEMKAPAPAPRGKKPPPPPAKAYVHLAPVGVSETFDDKYKTTLPTVMQNFLTSAIDGSSKLTTDVQPKGFYLDGSLALKRTATGIHAKLVMQLGTWPDKSMFGFPTSSAGLPVDNPKKIDKDVAFLIAELLKEVQEKVLSVLESRA